MRKIFTAAFVTLALTSGLLVADAAGAPGPAAPALDPQVSTVLYYGRAGDSLVAGRWSAADGSDGIGTVKDGVWWLRSDLSQGPAENVFAYGRSGDQTVTGDWNDDDVDGIATFLNGIWYLRNTATAGPAEGVVSYGNPGDKVITGDWDGDGTDGIGTFLGGTWYLRNSPSSGPADIVIRYGNPWDQVVVGDWDGNGTDGIGTFHGGLWYLRNSLSDGPAESVQRYGNPWDFAIASDWSGDGADGIATFLNGAWYFSEAKPAGLLHQLLVEPLSLLPGFRARAHDYAVYCPDRSNSLSVVAYGIAGTTITVEGRSSPGQWIGRVTVAQDEAIVVRVAGAGASEEYWVRCLPPGFPALDVARPGTTTPGYYLIDNAVLGGGPFYVIMLDAYGAPVWYKETATRRVDIKAMPGGLIGMLPNAFTPDNEFELRNLTGERVGGVKYVDQDPDTRGLTDFHDAILLRNGNYLLMSYTNRTLPGAAAIFGQTCGDGNTIYDFTMQEVTPANAPVWTWNSFEHFAFAETTTATCWNALPSPGDLGNDIIHPNSFEELGDGDILVSARNMNTVFRVDRQTGRVVWKIGGQNGNQNPDRPTVFRFVNDPLNGFCTQHDARILRNGNLHLFDNHGCGGNDARSVEYRLDPAAGTATLVRQIKADPAYYSPYVGSSRRQADGTTVVSWGGRGNPQFTEVGDDGAVLMRVGYADDSLTYRTVKVPVGTWTLNQLRNTAGGSLSLATVDKVRPPTHGAVP
jgi:hypothetical protein